MIQSAAWPNFFILSSLKCQICRTRQSKQWSKHEPCKDSEEQWTSLQPIGLICKLHWRCLFLYSFFALQFCLPLDSTELFPTSCIELITYERWSKSVYDLANKDVGLRQKMLVVYCVSMWSLRCSPLIALSSKATVSNLALLGCVPNMSRDSMMGYNVLRVSLCSVNVSIPEAWPEFVLQMLQMICILWGQSLEADFTNHYRKGTAC